MKHESREPLLAGPVAVLEVTEDRMADVIEVDPDLVAPSGCREDTEKGSAVEPLRDLPFGRRSLAPEEIDADTAGAELAERGVDPAAV